MDILGYTILVLILISGLPLLLFALRHGEDNADKTTDESEWYDENGNHIYYDRKLIRQQQKENAGKAPRVGYARAKGRYFVFCRVNLICKRH